MDDDAYRGGNPRFVDNALIRSLSRLNPVVALAYIFSVWLAIGVVLSLAHTTGAIPVYVIAILLIGGQQHALGALMHEAAHKRLLKSHRWNDIVGNLFCAWPILSTVEGYRRTHFAHHRATNTPDDPDWALKQNDDWAFPKSWTGIAWLFLRDVTAMNTHELLGIFRRYGQGGSSGATGAAGRLRKFGRLAYYLVIVALISWFSLWSVFLICWVLPFFTTFKAYIRWRTIAEHFGVAQDHVLRHTRTTYPGILGRLLIGPLNINYHLDHHLYPSVPFYNLPKLHRALLENPDYRENAHITKNGYWGVLKECAAGKTETVG